MVMSAAPLIRSGQLVPLLVGNVTDHMGVHVYYGSRTAQPSRVRAFIDLAVERLGDSSEYVLDARELAAAEQRSESRQQIHRRAITSASAAVTLSTAVADPLAPCRKRYMSFGYHTD